MIYFIVTVVAVILISLVPISVILVGPKMLLMPDRRKPEYYLEKFGFSHPSQIGLRYESGNVTTGDGYNLSYWGVENPKCDRTKGLVVYLHGITDSKVSGLNYAKQLAELCQKIYLIDMRRHGE
ncbi:MAG: hypothetical protein M1339_03960, partial [Bacteroidetes bacterium]|nr:hypothetical protein [Bacteroidota bacterium]